MYAYKNRKASAAVIAAVLALCIGEPSAADEQIPAPQAEVRESTTLYFDKGGRERTSLKARTNDAFDPLVTTGLRKKPGPEAASGKTSSTTEAIESAKGSNDFWFYYADVQLFSDDDNDGYFYGLDVLFDADTYFEVADVYAVLYLSYEGGPWNEYAVTEPFSIYGATSDDEYVVVTELETGYPTGSYDLLIELYDTYDGAFVADIGPEDDSGLGFLPLEDFNRDDPHRHDNHHRGGGGAIDWLTAVLLAGMLIHASYHRRRAAKVSDGLLRSLRASAGGFRREGMSARGPHHLASPCG
ncbi:MAG TPA: choice-of-anchor H family protein [Woeseiaceae bacterium]|nr:choice-of-anchor H family protein [Woeseiaceae bacterium]